LPSTRSVRLIVESSCTVMELLVAVKPETVWGVVGICSGTPAAGTGVGIVPENGTELKAMVAGVPPATSSWSAVVPDTVGDTACASLARPEGNMTTVWYPETENDCPGVGSVGSSEAVVCVSLKAMVPTGEPGQ